MLPLWLAVFCWCLGLATGAGFIILLLRHPGNNFLTPSIENFFIGLRNRAFKKLADEKIGKFNFYRDVFRAQTEAFKGLSNLQDLMIELEAIQDLEDMEKDRLETMEKINEAYAALQEKIAWLKIKNNQLH